MKECNVYSAVLTVAGIFITSGTVYAGGAAPPQFNVPTLRVGNDRNGHSTGDRRFI